MEYNCLVDSRFDHSTLNNIAWYLAYLDSRHKQEYRFYFWTDDLEEYLRSKFGDGYQKEISLHILRCTLCKKQLKDIEPLIRSMSYMCDNDPRFNYTTIHLFCDFEDEHNKEDIENLNEIFTEDFENVFRNHIGACQICKKLYEKFKDI